MKMKNKGLMMFVKASHLRVCACCGCKIRKGDPVVLNANSLGNEGFCSGNCYRVELAKQRAK